MTKKEEQALLVFERKILRRIYGPKYENGEWKVVQELSRCNQNFLYLIQKSATLSAVNQMSPVHSLPPHHPIPLDPSDTALTHTVFQFFGFHPNTCMFNCTRKTRMDFYSYKRVKMFT
jgi:hypothetical protein